MKKLKPYFILLLICISIYPLSAQSGKEFNGALLWKISGKDLKEPSYILGTHHWTETSFLDSIQGINQAFDGTQQLIGELVLTDMPLLQQAVMRKSLLPDSISYRSLLSPEDYIRFEDRLSAVFGNAKDRMKKLTPWLLSMSYYLTIYAELYPHINFQGLVSMDEYLQKKAVEEGKVISGLETVDDQITALYYTDPLDVQAENLLCLLSMDKEKLIDATQQVADCYRQGDLIGLYKLTEINENDPCPPTRESMDAINKNRNDKWLQKLPDLMADKPSLIVVGALHLAGEDGLLYQLDTMGYTVEAVK